MIVAVYGTTGELIKLGPLFVQLNNRGAPPLTVCTGQQAEQIPVLLNELGLPEPDIWLARGRRGHDLERAGDLPGWLFHMVVAFGRHRRWLWKRLRSTSSKPLLVVHGDTFTTVLGALMGHALHVPVAHIEAGLRSGDWRNPFPEELDRLITSRLARIHLAPGRQATANLHAARVRGEIVDTGANTICDALALVSSDAPEIEFPREPFGIASLHRFELLSKPAALKAILEILREASQRTQILFVDHPVTVAAIADHKFESLFNDRLRRVPRQRYFGFIRLLKASTFLVTDSGGSQEECAHLGHPCLVHRAATERLDGLDGSVVLSRMRPDVVREFLEDPLAYARTPMVGLSRPTDLIISYLDRRGHIPRGDDAELPFGSNERQCSGLPSHGDASWC